MVEITCQRIFIACCCVENSASIESILAEAAIRNLRKDQFVVGIAELATILRSALLTFHWAALAVLADIVLGRTESVSADRWEVNRSLAVTWDLLWINNSVGAELITELAFTADEGTACAGEISSESSFETELLGTRCGCSSPSRIGLLGTEI